jgi:pimeloyl-[acyl-carrier protein] methyl ester esterase
VKLVFVHGWGFGSTIWAGLSDGFADRAFFERGYFGAPAEALPEGEFVAVTHSFGTMRVLEAIPPGCRGIVAVNGFDRFAAGKGFPGVAPRVLDRMIARFGDQPERVVAEFLRRCGCETFFGEFDRHLLLEDLHMLRDGDFREQAAGCGLPILSLQGGQDPILPEAMRASVFAGAVSCERLTFENGGHLLPLEETASCAQAISAFMERLT